jgi:F1F0 ATPase subunit 2
MDAQAMTNFQPGDYDLILYVLSARTWLTIGAAIGALHFLTLRWNARMFYVSRSLVLAFATQLARFALIAGMLGVIARHFGAIPLLIAAAGVLAARTMILRWSAQS